jgi:hypothetical protein
MAKTVEHCPTKHESLGSNPNTARDRGRKKREQERLLVFVDPDI